MADYRIGFHSSDITPDWEHNKVKLGGYIRWRKYISGVYDPLMARALCIRSLTDPSKSVILISADLVGIQYRLAKLARVKISEKTKVPINNILIHVTHTHSSPDTIGLFPVTIYSDIFRLDVPRNAALVAVKGFIEAGVKSFDSATQKFKIGYGTGNEFPEAIAKQRRHPYEQIHDPILFIKFTDESDQLLALLVNYQGHPTLMPQANTKVSGEYPAKFVQAIHKKLPELKFAAYYNGFCGDVSLNLPRSKMNWGFLKMPKSERSDAVYKILEVLGDFMADSIVEAVKNTECKPLKDLDVIAKSMVAEFGRIKPWNQRKKLYKGLATKTRAKLRDLEVRLLFTLLYGFIRFFRKDRFPILNVKRQRCKLFHITQFQIFKFNEILMVCLPGEPFILYKKYLEEHAKKPQTTLRGTS